MVSAGSHSYFDTLLHNIKKLAHSADAVRVMNSLQGVSLTATIFVSEESILSEREYTQLIEYVDSKCVPIVPDFVLQIMEDVHTLLGDDSTKQLLESFEQHEGMTCVIKLHRVEASGQQIPVHIDHAPKSVHVVMNSTDKYTRACLVFVNQDEFHVCDKRKQGTYIIHCNNIAHGVSKMESGVSYSLFLTSIPSIVRGKLHDKCVAATQKLLSLYDDFYLVHAAVSLDSLECVL